MTRTYSVPLGGPRLKPGARLGATVAAGGRHLGQAVVTLNESVENAGFVAAHPFAHHRYLPSIDLSGDDYVEMVELDIAPTKGAVFTAAVDEFEVFNFPTEELTLLPVSEVSGAYYQEIDYVFNGGKSLWRA